MLVFNPRPLQGNVNPSRNTTKPMSPRQISNTIKLKTFNFIFQTHFKHNRSAFIYYSVQNLKGFLMVYKICLRLMYDEQNNVFFERTVPEIQAALLR